MFNENDINQITSKSLSIEDIEKQISYFKRGFPFIKLKAAAIPGNGLKTYKEPEIIELAAFYDKKYKDHEIIKFVPASGAASRMFKHLFEFSEKLVDVKDIEQFITDEKYKPVFQFFSKLKSFAFYNDLETVLHDNGLNIDNLLESEQYELILDYFLTDKGLNYTNLPKGLLAFHAYKDGNRLSVEEHLVEGAHYSTDPNKISHLHLTVSSEHLEKFEKSITECKTKYEDKFGVKFQIEYSKQKPSTDIIAVNMDNNPFKLEDGSLLFRPGGHGALIENLNDLEADIIFIKNIDNIVPDRLRKTTYLYKKVIGGLLIKLQEKTFELLEGLNSGNLSDEELEDIKTFAENELNIFIPNAYKGYDKMDRVDYLYNMLNRPIRICGMVKNEGEPGGGPYWVINENDDLSLQIIESSQMDLNDPSQMEIVSGATHFNPVDIVCGIKNYKAEKFDLNKYVDPKTGFISIKSQNGKDLKAQELPGLWNGAMADWITIFVETPLITFNPVKTINDLLRPEHQPE